MKLKEIFYIVGLYLKVYFNKALILSKMLFKKNEEENYLNKKKILELCCGTGIVGIFCSLICLLYTSPSTRD